MLANDLALELADAAEVKRESHDGLRGHCVTISPRRGDALGIWWADLDAEVILETTGGSGGRWELDRSLADFEFLESIVRSVVAGRVSGVGVPGRSRVTVILDDGTSLTSGRAEAPVGCLPLPFWTRWGHKVRYAPYVG